LIIQVVEKHSGQQMEDIMTPAERLILRNQYTIMRVMADGERLHRRQQLQSSMAETNKLLDEASAREFSGVTSTVKG
jgi:uncharacterized protein YfbU (UPF0304 family)